MSSALELKVSEALDRSGGKGGAYALNLSTGAEVSVRADDVRPAASAGKIFVLLKWASDVATGRNDPDDRIEVTSDDRVIGSGIVRYFAPGLKPTETDLAYLMMTISDNVATNVLIEAVGGPGQVAEFASSIGFSDLEIAQIGVATTSGAPFSAVSPRSLAGAFELIARPNDHDYPEVAATLCKKILRRNEHTGGLPRHIPFTHHAKDYGFDLGIEVYSKPGSYPTVQTDAALVETKSGSWVAAAMLESLTDLRSGSTGAGPLALSEIGKFLWEAWG